MVSSANAMVSVSAFSIVLFEDIKRRCTCVARPRRAAEDGSVADEQWITVVCNMTSLEGRQNITFADCQSDAVHSVFPSCTRTEGEDERCTEKSDEPLQLLPIRPRPF
ncbi:hypothetical protein BLNAU_21751 [Blattamonas nauphoetae]|uniref:Secreted protein n=1 Tax=Blattamonas nauphoetae TaxID=2049346 RepID=A0ABQ9WUZ1_9EUKA|nr:hypothetical protein BLNAU_21751 [Blattamonas nauphoetae]